MEKIAQLYDAEKYPNFKEYLWFKAHEAELAQRYYGRFIVIKDGQVTGDFGSRKLARQEAVKHHKPGSFIIHYCGENDAHRLPRLIGHQLVSVYEK